MGKKKEMEKIIFYMFQPFKKTVQIGIVSNLIPEHNKKNAHILYLRLPFPLIEKPAYRLLNFPIIFCDLVCPGSVRVP